jgi:hypothetical protein
MQSELCYNIDEGERIRKAVLRDRLHREITNRVREAREWNLFDYERPLWACPKVEGKRFSIKKLINKLLP